MRYKGTGGGCTVRNVMIILLINIIQVLKLRRMRWARPMAHGGGERRCIQGFGGET
jgi:hypothetical protein